VANDGNKPLTVAPPGLAIASGAFSSAQTIMQAASSAYKTGADAPDGVFGMVEDASAQLTKDYKTFYANVVQQLQYMTTALGSAAGYTKLTQQNYTNAEIASTVRGS
jgi:hypothetical protein